MPETKLTQFLLLPKLKLLNTKVLDHRKGIIYYCETNIRSSFCPHCGLETSSVHDRRTVSVRDAPLSDRKRKLVIKKKRFRCQGLGYKKVFTESIEGIKKALKLGNKTLYERHYKQLDLEHRKIKNDPLVL